MGNKKIFRTSAALLAAALVATSGVSVMSASAATTAAQSSISASAGIKVSFSKLSSYYVIDLSQSFSTSVSVSDGKAAYNYRFGYINNGKTTYVKAVSTSSPYYTYSYKFTKSGTYTPIVEVKDAAGSKTTQKLGNVTVVDLGVSFGGVSAKIIDKSQAFQVSASLNGGTGAYTYKFGYTKDGKTTYVKTVNTSAPYTTYTYKFSEAGSYVPVLEVVDAKGARRTTKLSSAVTVKDLGVSFGGVSAKIIDKSQAFQVSASLNGGKGEYTYKFGYTKDGKSTYVKTVKTSAPYVSYTYKFDEAGSYVPFVEIVDADGARRTTKLSSAVTVKDLGVSFGGVSAKIIDKSQAFQVSASLNGGKGEYTYKFGYAKDGKSTYVNTVKTSAPYVAYTYKFSEAGSYVPFVEIVDADGARRTTKLSSTVTVKDLGVSFGGVSAKIIDKSQAFQVSASLNGGKGEYTYKFGYTKDGKSTYVKTVKTAAPYVSYTYKFSEAGSYVPFVEIVDADGARRTTKLSSAVTVKDLGVSFGGVSAKIIDKSQAFQVSVSLNGGKGQYTYKFGYTKDGKSTYVNTVKTSAPYVSYTYKFTEAGSYVPFVEIVDADGARRTTKLSSAVTVKDLKVSFGSLSSYNIKKTQGFQTTCSVGGGSAEYKYNFGYINNGKTTYVLKTSSYSPYMTNTYKFPAAGSYVPFVEVVDADGARTTVKLSAVTVNN